MNLIKTTSNRTLLWTAAAALVLSLALTPAAFANEAYLHVHITDAHGSTSKINLSASSIGNSIPGLPAGMLEDGVITIQGAEIDLYQLRQLWIAMRDVDDATFVSLDTANESLRLKKEDGHLIARATPKTAEGRSLEARIPNAAVDALLSGADNQIDIAAALETLASYGGQDLVTMSDNGTNIRVWVDWNPEG